MSGNATDKTWEHPDSTDCDSRGLLADIADTLSYLSVENRAERRRRKLRQDLVRDYIEDKKQSTSLAQSVLVRMFKSP